MDDFGLLVQVAHVEPDQSRRPVERLGDAWHFPQILLADFFDHPRDLQRQCRAGIRDVRRYDARLTVDSGIVDVVIETAAAQRVG